MQVVGIYLILHYIFIFLKQTFFLNLISIIGTQRKSSIIKLKKILSRKQYQCLTQCIAPLSSYTPIWGSIFLFYIIERMGLCPTTLYTHTRSMTCAARRGERATVAAPPQALGELSAVPHPRGGGSVPPLPRLSVDADTSRLFFMKVVIEFLTQLFLQNL